MASSNVVDQHIKQELETAFMDLRKSDKNHEKLLEFVDNSYRANRLKTPELDQAARIPPAIFHDLSSFYNQLESMQETLRSLDGISDEDLGGVDTRRKVSDILFTAAAAMAAAVAAANTKKHPAGAAAAASILLVALGKWYGSVLRKRERAAKKRKVIIRVMSSGAKRGMQYLKDIHALAHLLNFEAESKSETAVDGEMKESEVVKKSLEELRLKVEDYNRDLWTTEVLLQCVITR